MCEPTGGKRPTEVTKGESRNGKWPRLPGERMQLGAGIWRVPGSCMVSFTPEVVPSFGRRLGGPHSTEALLKTHPA